MKANRGQLIISVACLGVTLIPDMSGFCSVDVVHGNLSQKQEKAALLVLPRVPGRGFGGGGGFEFSVTNWAWAQINLLSGKEKKWYQV